ncbi:MAG: hypothetical protein RIC16_00900 [Rhodospirillales bacterium]
MSLAACVLLTSMLSFGAFSGAVAQVTTPEAEPEPPAGGIRIQGRDADPDDTGPDLGPAIPLLDFREEMRSFVSRIGQFARRYKPDFSILVEDSLDLLVKRDDLDETQISPARAYMRSIDGVLVTNLFNDNPNLDAEDNEAIRKRRLSLLDHAEENGLRVFVLDQETDQARIDEARRQAREHGYAYQPRRSRSFETTDLPVYPSRPFDETGNSVISLDDADNFGVVGNSAAYGRQDEFALKMHGTNYDVLIVDVFHGREPLSRQAVETLKYKASGARRLVFARVNVGTAASYRYYWQPNWQEGSPRWIGASVRGEPDNYFVEFWRPEWQRIIFGDTASYVYGVVDQGYDGVVLGGADVFEIYEGGEAAESRVQ